jgi:hypothetical protein
LHLVSRLRHYEAPISDPGQVRNKFRRVNYPRYRPHIHPEANGKTTMSVYIAALWIGVIAGLRAMMAPAAVAGAVGAVIGTLGGYEFRSRLAKAIGIDLPAALLEDVIAIGGAFWIVSHTL